MTAPQSRSGQGWAYAGVVLGGAVSVAANVAATFIPPSGAARGWTPQPGAVVSAVFWPLLLLVAVELFARIPWPPGLRWWLLRAAGLLPVAAIAAVVSYRHLSALLRFYGEDPLTALLGPLAVDGLMTMAAGALLAHGRTPDRSTPAADTGDVDPVPRAPMARTVPPRHTGGTGRAHRSDAELIAAVQRLTRDSDGTVPVRRAAKALGTGPDRARRLLSDAGLLRTRRDSDRSSAPRSTPPAVPVRVPDPPIPADLIDGLENDAR